MNPNGLARTVAADGWAVIDLLDPAAIVGVRGIIDAVDLDRAHGFYASPAASWGALARSIDRELKDTVAPHAARVLPGMQPFLAGITSKGARSDSVISFHQDWTYTDERSWRVVFLWCPLVDVSERNGALRVVPGSHRWSADIRPSRSVEVTEGLQQQLLERSTCVNLRAGQALAFDPATLHGSGPNETDEVRPAFTMAFTDPAAQLLHFHLGEDGRLEGFVVDEAFFTEHPYRTRPTRYVSCPPHASALTEATLRAAMGGRRHRWRLRRGG